jgi:hypothetical protein
MKQLIIQTLAKRLEDEISSKNPLKFLKDINLKNSVDEAIGVLYLYTRVRPSKDIILMADIITAIGNTIRTKNKLKRDSALAAKAGAFYLHTFEQNGLIQVRLSRGKTNTHATYQVDVLNDDAISELWRDVEVSKPTKLPSLTAYSDWTTYKHENGNFLVKTSDRETLESLTPENCPIVFDCINKAQRIGWRINEDIYHLHLWALRNKTDAFADIWELQNQQAKASKVREAKIIGDIAKKFLHETFYHSYYLDFRGRRYPSTAFLHEQGSDLAKGLLLKASGKPITKDGFFWLCVSIASNWAGDAGRDDGQKTDKIPLNDRFLWVKDNEEILVSYAASPKVNQGWMKADKPWQFLAACIELKKFRDWQARCGNHAGMNRFEWDQRQRKLRSNVRFETTLGGHTIAFCNDEMVGEFTSEAFCTIKDFFGVMQEYGVLDEYGYVTHLDCFIDGLLKSRH